VSKDAPFLMSITKHKKQQQSRIALYCHYSEKEAARFVQVDDSTLKRWCRRTLTPCVNCGADRARSILESKLRILIIRGTGPRDDTPTGFYNLAFSGSDVASIIALLCP
jgi:hypothetical protein